jgi:hypothetical protein
MNRYIIHYWVGTNTDITRSLYIKAENTSEALTTFEEQFPDKVPVHITLDSYGE